MTKPTVHQPKNPAAVDAAGLLAELRELIHSARQRVATVANAEQTLLYWRLGKRILTENLIEGRAEYGHQFLRHCRKNWWPTLVMVLKKAPDTDREPFFRLTSRVTFFRCLLNRKRVAVILCLPPRVTSSNQLQIILPIYELPGCIGVCFEPLFGRLGTCRAPFHLVAEQLPFTLLDKINFFL